MLSTYVNGNPVWLVNCEPNWAQPVDCKFRILTDYERGLTGKEDRVATSKSLRASMKYQSFMRRADATAFRTALKTLGNTPVLCPFWPAQEKYSGSDKAGISAKLWLVREPDWSAWELYNDGDTPVTFTPSAKAFKAPVLWGRFEEFVKPKLLTDELTTFDLSFTDNSSAEYALTVEAQAMTDGPQISGTAFPMFPLLPNWAEEVTAGESVVDIVKDDIGFSRQTSDVFYPQTGARKLGQTFACKNWTEFKKALYFFLSNSGNVGKFWVPAYVGDTRLTGQTTSKILVTGCLDAQFNTEYFLIGDEWLNESETISIYKDVIWYMTDGTIEYTAPDNGLDTPPATFTRSA